MAGLARLAGIPSRIAVGYTAGTHAGHSATWKVTTADAHAWPELYFSGAGLDPVRADPRRRRRPGHGDRAAVRRDRPARRRRPDRRHAPGQNPGSKAGAGAAPERSAHLHGLGGGRRPGHRDRRAAPDRGHRPVWILLIVAIRHRGRGAIAPPIARSADPPPAAGCRRAGDAGLAHAAWRELRDDLADYGLACRPSESPRAVAARVTADAARWTRRPARPWPGSSAPRSARATRRRRSPRRRCARTAPRSGGRWRTRRAGRSAGARACCRPR